MLRWRQWTVRAYSVQGGTYIIAAPDYRTALQRVDELQRHRVYRVIEIIDPRGQIVDARDGRPEWE